MIKVATGKDVQLLKTILVTSKGNEYVHLYVGHDGKYVIDLETILWEFEPRKVSQNILELCKTQPKTHKIVKALKLSDEIFNIINQNEPEFD